MELLKRTFLYHLYQTDKLLLALVLVYVLGLGFFILKQREEFPFLHYGMYSLNEQPRPQYTTYAITVDGTELDYQKVLDVQREVILSTLQHAIQGYNTGQITAPQMEQYKAWLFGYIADMRTIENNHMVVEEVNCAYNEQGKVKVVNRKILFEYDAQ